MNLLIFLFILGILIVVHEFGHFMAAKKVGVKVEKFSFGFGRKIISKKINDTEYLLSAIPLGGYVKLAGDSLEEYKGAKDEYFSKPAGKRFWIILCGPLLNYVLGFFLFFLVFLIGYPMVTNIVGGVKEGFGAQEAGIRSGDKIIAVDGQEVLYWDELKELISKKEISTSAKITVLRDGKEYSFDVKIKEDTFSGASDQKQPVGVIGIEASKDMVLVKHSLIESYFLSAQKAWDLTVLTYKALWRMITGKMSLRGSVTGVVGMYVMTAHIAKAGIVALMDFLGILSISLAIFNLLPFPVLDGGHILFLAIEKIRGKALGLKTEKVVTQLGLSVIIMLALFVTYNDVVRFFGDKIAKIFK